MLLQMLQTRAATDEGAQGDIASFQAIKFGNVMNDNDKKNYYQEVLAI